MLWSVTTIVIEYVEKGAVMDGEKTETNPFDLDTSRRYFRDMILGLEYCESTSIDTISRILIVRVAFCPYYYSTLSSCCTS
jgi:hypothetical protein